LNKKMIKKEEEMSKEEYKNWRDLNFDERVKVIEGFVNTEDRNESDKDNPREEDVKDYYEDNTEKFNFVFCEHEWVSDGVMHLDCLGECYKKPVKCEHCGLKADEVYIFSCVARRDTGETI